METLPSPYDPLFSNYAQISFRNWVQSLEKWCHLNFDDGFEFEDLENILDRWLLQIELIW